MPNEPVVSTQGLIKMFGGVKAVGGVDFSLQQGELRCLIGPNGAGKSTFFKLLTGQIKATGGEVRLFGKFSHTLTSHQIAAKGVGIKNQLPDVMNGLTARENIWLSASRLARGAKADTIVDEIAID